MSIVVGIKFKKNPKIYYFEAGGFSYNIDDKVIVETTRGLEIGSVAFLPTKIDSSKAIHPIKPVFRLATEDDILSSQVLEDKLPQVTEKAMQLIKKSGLDMKLVDAEYTFDGTKLVFYFIAEGRVDFRELVKELATVFKTRIELKQIGARDECKFKGGLGPCGRGCCCNQYMSDFAHATIKMAKNQNLSLNPGKISGLCGRLMCCLSFENDYYTEINKKMPKIGSEVKTLDGKSGIVTAISQLKELVTVRVNEKDIFTNIDYPLSNIVSKDKFLDIDESDKTAEEFISLED